MMNDSNVYRVYLLRLWQENELPTDETAPLRIVLEEPRSGSRLSFPSLRALLLYLEDEVAGEGNRRSSELKEV